MFVLRKMIKGCLEYGIVQLNDWMDVDATLVMFFIYPDRLDTHGMLFEIDKAWIKYFEKHVILFGIPLLKAQR